MECPAEHTLLAWMDGELDPVAKAAVDAHLGGCAACAAVTAAAIDASLKATTAPAPSTAEDDEETEPGALTAGGRIDRYVVLAPIGSGAMGVVYKAWDPELGRQVALKLLRPEHGERGDGRARLLREAQAMARLSHHHVVAVYDAGTWKSQVFIAMELIEGCTLSGWMAEKARPWREVLDIFLRAGQGLAAAHAAGLVHRDFKPDNVLVGADGRLRVTDFGLARLSDKPEPLALFADGEASAKSPVTPRTAAGALIGSPAYMSPEQLRGQPADERSDLFGYCVSLYEALYGERPFAGANLHALRDSIESGKIRAAPPKARVPGWLRKAVLRGLQANREARPASMAELLSELSRDPIHRRRRWLLAGAALLLAVAAGLFGRSAARAATCRDLPQKLAGVWDGKARAAAKKAFLATEKPFAAAAWNIAESALDRYGSGWAAMRTEACEAAHVRGEQSQELYDLRMACLDGRLGELAARSTLFAHADDAVVTHAADLVSSLPSLSACADARALRDRARPPPPSLRLRVSALREQLSSAEAARVAGKFAPAIPEVRKVAAEAEALGYRPLQAEAARELGKLEESAGNLADAAEAFHAATAFAAAGGADSVAAASWSLLVPVELKLGRRDQAAHATAQARAAIERLGGDASLEADLEEVLADLAQAQDKLAEALEHAARAVEIIERTPQPDALRLSTALSRLALAHESQGQNSEAAQLLERSRALALQRLGPDHPALAEIDTSIADQLFFRGKLAEATEKYRQALTVFERAYPPDHPLVGHALFELGWCLAAYGRGAEAAALQRRALAIYQHALGPDAPMVSNVLYSLGKVEIELAEFASAHEHLERTIELDERIFGVRSLESASGHQALATALLEEGRLKEARVQAQLALDIRLATVGADHFRLVPTLRLLGQLALREGHAAEAVSWQRQALAIEDRRAEADRGQAPVTLVRLGEALLAQQELAEAKSALEKAVLLLQTAPPDGSLALAQFLLARTLTALHDSPARALQLAQGAREGFSRANPIWAGQRRQVEAWLAKRSHTGAARASAIPDQAD